QNYGESEEDKAKYLMWLEDAESLALMMKELDEENVAGVAGWKLGLESADVWDVIIKYVN
ncbi:MAG: chitinase, partial [Acetivibrio sp.]